MVATPATTLAGIAAKMQIALRIWPAEVEGYHEEVAAAFIADAARVLAGELARHA